MAYLGRTAIALFLIPVLLAGCRAPVGGLLDPNPIAKMGLPSAADGGSGLPATGHGMAENADSAAGGRVWLTSWERDPRRLIAMSQAHLADLLGRPDFSRWEGEVRVWQYRFKGCVLDLFLYLDDGPSDYRVLYYEFRSASRFALSPDRCFENLVRRRMSVTSGRPPARAAPAS